MLYSLHYKSWHHVEHSMHLHFTAQADICQHAAAGGEGGGKGGGEEGGEGGEGGGERTNTWMKGKQ